MTDELYVDPHHRLSDEDFAEVCKRAKEIREEIKANAQGGASSSITPLNDMTALGIASGKYFAESGIPTQLLVVHSGECPLSGGYARSLTLWASTVYPQAPIASWQWFQDPLEMVAFIPPNLGAWHASEANVLSEGFEQSGYARYSRAEWLTPDGLTQLESLAFYMAQRAVFNGIPARWLTDEEVTRATGGDRSVKGLCFHRQIDPETRTDPGNGYPADVLLERIQFYMGSGTLASAGTTTTEDKSKGEHKMIVMATDGKSPQVWIGDGIVRRPVWSLDTMTAVQWLDEHDVLGPFYKDGEVQTVPDLNAIGIDLVALIRSGGK